MVSRNEQHMDLQTGSGWEQGAEDSLWTFQALVNRFPEQKRSILQEWNSDVNSS